MTQSKKREHDVVVEMLPWYANGTLNPAEQARVTQHLASCQECRQELLLCRQLDSVCPVKSDTQLWQPSPAGFANILKGIDALERVKGAKVSSAKMPGRLGNLRAGLNATPRSIRWLMTLETVALAALLLMVIGRFSQPPEERLFQTLSNQHQPVNEMLPRLSIVFAEDITEREIRELLQSQHGQLVQGPSMLGVYTVQLASAGKHELQQAVISLRTHPKVKLVEAITGGGR